MGLLLISSVTTIFSWNLNYIIYFKTLHRIQCFLFIGHVQYLSKTQIIKFIFTHIFTLSDVMELYVSTILNTSCLDV